LPATDVAMVFRHQENVRGGSLRVKTSQRSREREKSNQERKKKPPGIAQRDRSAVFLQLTTKLRSERPRQPNSRRKGGVRGEKRRPISSMVSRNQSEGSAIRGGALWGRGGISPAVKGRKWVLEEKKWPLRHERSLTRASS